MFYVFVVKELSECAVHFEGRLYFFVPLLRGFGLRFFNWVGNQQLDDQWSFLFSFWDMFRFKFVRCVLRCTVD